MNKVIFNSEHIDTLKNLLKESDEAIIISPFLSFFKDFNIGDYNVDLKLYTKFSENKKDSINAERYLIIEQLINWYNKSNKNIYSKSISNIESKLSV